MDGYYKLPAGLGRDIEEYAGELKEFLSGRLSPARFKAKRVPRGVYEQRRDGAYMVRIRVAGGVMNAEQSECVADMSREFGNGLVHVTTRQDTQLHDIDINDTPEIMRRLADVGLTTKGGGGNTVRNVAACPYAGICPYERFDVTPFAQAVTEYLIALPGSYNLPRKYKIAFSGCTADCALAQVTDLGFIAEVRDGDPGFRVYAGGGMGAHSRKADLLLEWLPARSALRAAESVRRLFDALGDRKSKHRARLRFVFEKLGVAEFRKRFKEVVSTLNEYEVPEYNVDCRIVNDKHGDDFRAPPELNSGDGLQYLPQRQEGFAAVHIHLPLGFVGFEDFHRIGRLAAEFSSKGELRTTRRQNLLLPFVKESEIRSLSEELGCLEIGALKQTSLSRFTACAGASTCRLGLCLARDAAMEAAVALDSAEIPPETFQALEVFINGCPNACGQQPIAPIGFYGATRRVGGRLVPMYRITIGGRVDAACARFGEYVGQVPAKALPALVRELVGDFQKNKNGKESFVEYYERKDTAYFKGLATKYFGVPEYDEDSSFYCDCGSCEDFTLSGRGAGECGAGVIEVIREEIAAAKRTADSFEKLVLATRALLVARGIDSKDEGEVFTAFEKHFIDTGLVAPEFRSLISRGRGYIEGWKEALTGQSDFVEDLLKRVEVLFTSMDSSLEFHPPDSVQDKAEAENSPENARRVADPTATETLDLKGVACPVNFVKTMMKLEKMNEGDVLDVILDDGEPVQSVPGSLMHEGYEIKGMTRLPDGHWRFSVIVKDI